MNSIWYLKAEFVVANMTIKRKLVIGTKNKYLLEAESGAGPLERGSTVLVNTAYAKRNCNIKLVQTSFIHNKSKYKANVG